MAGVAAVIEDGTARRSDAAVVPGFQTSEKMEQGRFAGTGRAGDRDAFACLRGKRHATQDLDALSVWRDKTLSQIDNADHESRNASTGRKRDAACAG